MRLAELVSPFFCALVLVDETRAQLVVPGTHPDPQSAVDAAPDDAVVYVRGGTWGSLVLRRPVTIVAEPRATFVAENPTPGPTAHAPIHLDGPGHGEVVLCNVETSSDRARLSYETYPLPAGIAGGGFAELHVYESRVLGVAQDPGDPDYTVGACGLDVDVPFVWLERCEVGAADTIAPEIPWWPTSPPEAGPGVRASGTVVVLDSLVQGGSFLPFEIAGGSCPLTSCPPGPGGVAVEAEELVHAQSELRAGSPVPWWSAGVPCCTSSAGEPVSVAAEQALHGGLTAVTGARLGETLLLAWSLPSTGRTLLVAAADVGPPQPLGGGSLFLDLSQGQAVSWIPPVGSRAIRVPNDVSLLGQEYGFQAWVSGIGPTRPVSVVIQP